MNPATPATPAASAQPAGGSAGTADAAWPPVARRCVCPGSYDPVTNGHLGVIRRAAAVFDDVVVAVMHNPAKQGAFTPAERVAFLAGALGGLPGVTVAAFGGRLLVDICSELQAPVVVKGLRGPADFAYELPMAVMNRALAGVETVFLPGDPAYGHVSSSLVREVAGLGGDVTGLVPDAVREALEARRAARDVG